jgi:hypothetical protein
MTMTEGMVRPGALSARGGRLAVAIHLPWYRSLPVSCLESVRVAVDGVPAHVRSVAIDGFTGPVEEAAASDATWDIRDTLAVVLGQAARPGDVRTVEVALAVRIPYLQQAPGVPLVHRASARTEGALR